jgi:ribose/xylose/arabinose/galactoside ABC-type transport system permease subunit
MKVRSAPRNDPHARPLAILLACIMLLAVADWGRGEVLSAATAITTLDTFGTIGLVALGLGLSMMIREFDLSVIGMFSMAGCIAVLTGAQHPWIGLACALGVGLIAGTVQGLIIVWLRLGSIGVTLGGLLVFSGFAYVLSENRTLPYENMAAAMALSERIGGVFTIRSLTALAIFVMAALVIGMTRIGRDVIATGSDRRASMTAGVNVDALIVGIFAFSGTMAALAGALLSYSLASASPSGLSDVIVPAAAAAILGGVSLAGGTGRPLGIALGVLVLGVLRSGLNAIGAQPYVNEITMGVVLMAVAVADGPNLIRRLRVVTRPKYRRDPPA